MGSQNFIIKHNIIEQKLGGGRFIFMLASGACVAQQ